MKNIKIVAVLVLAISFFSFTLLKERQVDVETSKISWIGKKVTGSHEGTINLQSGVLKFDGKKLVGGSFVMDMSTINVTDMQGKGKANLEGHLKSDDFFGVEKHKTATLEITKVTNQYSDYEVTGQLTIKGITKPISFNMVIKENSASTKLTIDRTKFDIKYGSASFIDNLKDKAISDDFELDVKLSF
ncbi:YceI family protein [uncultured Winogradskyella sp.]|uniref:YceI family protein n=1 Tax=uncultured Winogradskyella sp. TaxID=395353 RepID=UPI0026392EE5|nr:YceI family protein [uncultured Winogradskyella sp.]